MQLPSSTNAPAAAVSTALYDGAGAAADPARESRIDAKIAQYYSDLVNNVPAYLDLQMRAIMGTPLERDVHAQVETLIHAMKFIQQREEAESAAADEERLNRFLDQLSRYGQPGALSEAEAHFVYTKPFKHFLERSVAAIDMARPEDREQAQLALHRICTLLGSPSEFVKLMYAKTTIDRYCELFEAALSREPSVGTGYRG
ncbi:hypothetical protein [Bordetella genomosp. 9]|uniref:Uncharacterized protein n=1 Tax=Bordetella genomosp. 9 TaxID=1416803 RepID=A0A1W6Z349_9BORD|nr:hypothetical protein [Bordetella genomosp. 9]ARP87549.1 hypothetical protein CAL13_16065 [Bordetella genomosp. 9]